MALMSNFSFSLGAFEKVAFTMKDAIKTWRQAIEEDDIRGRLLFGYSSSSTDAVLLPPQVGGAGGVAFTQAKTNLSQFFCVKNGPRADISISLKRYLCTNIAPIHLPVLLTKHSRLFSMLFCQSSHRTSSSSELDRIKFKI